MRYIYVKFTSVFSVKFTETLHSFDFQLATIETLPLNEFLGSQWTILRILERLKYFWNRKSGKDYRRTYHRPRIPCTIGASPRCFLDGHVLTTSGEIRE